MKQIIIIIYCLLFVNITFSQNEKADAEFLKIVKEYTLNVDGSIDFHYSKSVKLLSHFSFHRLYGETFIVYNTDFQSLKINSASTTMADGKKVVTPANAFNEVLPRYCADAPSFNNIREMVVTHTGLEVGAVVNLDYTIHTISGYNSSLMGNDVLSETSPVNELIIKVVIPDSKELNYQLFNIVGEPKAESKNGKKIYTWKFNSIPANSKDSYQDNFHQDEPRMIFSTTNMESSLQSFVDQDAFDFTSNSSIDEVVNNIMKTESYAFKIALEIQRTVSNDIGNIDIPLVYTGFKCRSPIEIWNSNQGTPLEKAILITTMLRKANIQAEPVALIPISYFNKDVGDLAIMEKFMVRAKIRSQGDFYFSPDRIDKQNQKFNIEGLKAVVLDKQINKITAFEGSMYTSGISFVAEFDMQNTDKLLGTISLELKNQANPYIKLFDDDSKIASILDGISDKDVMKSAFTKLTQENCTVLLTIDKTNPTIKSQGNYSTFELPGSSIGVDSWHMTVLPAKRTASLEIPDLIDENYSYAVVLPKDAKLVSKLQDINIKNDIGSLLIKVEKNQNEVIVIRRIVINKKGISIAEYPQFKEIMDLWNNDNFRNLFFKK